MGNANLEMWQSRLERNESAYESKLDDMDRRERAYKGSRVLDIRVAGDRKRKANHVRNLTAEIIEAQVNSSIPQPKVTAKRQKDEKKAKIIEDMLRNELNRMPFEMLNDQQERTVPIQGGGMFLVEWDNTQRSHTTVGELNVSLLHPKQVIPQDGVYSGIEDMDYIILKIPQTKEYIRRRYNVRVKDESEQEPDIKSESNVSPADDMVTQYIAYYRNSKGGIGLYSWVNDIELEDLDDYQARRVQRCTVCGEAKPLEGGKCPKCGSSKWTAEAQEYETLSNPVKRSDGSEIPAAVVDMATLEVKPTRIPYYQPNIYPIILQKNVSLFGEFLGDSDVDKVRDQQNTCNRIESKIVEKLVKSGSYMILPDDASIRADAEDMKVIRPGNAGNAQLISVKDMQGNISQDLTYLAQVYEEARQIIGITDSFQGRRDNTATSGTAKEFAAAQAAGRLESKRVMKDAAYAALFEAMFKFKLAYADEPRPVLARDMNGDTVYEEFNRYDFLEQDKTGEWYWNDQFLFSCDTTAPLANNREAMWQETRTNLQSGAFGDPTDLQTLILYWTKMEQLHYPGSSETKAFMEMRYQQQLQAQVMQQQQMMQMQAQAQQMNAQADAMQAMRTQTGNGGNIQQGG